ncbi:osmoprotectant transport system substrate-binding protein [Trichococcus patagoniensis]|uniref:Osmoprotectant transport system substrate-binding protein n=1 Tax=Trichococcus patagoniensis TaxID=382641 RepID=A0A2T5I7J4_9LACT|nr:glycine betaine ABC transporter substrate-binding protein [Trichococcus patagoniensis]PTQ79796.1 osmoprotectant transport system substrate-binding protein [Trichococcus patagoniensis]
MKKSKLYIFTLVLVLSVLSACGSSIDKDNNEAKNSDDPIVLGSFVDTEGGILGNMVLLALEENGYTITDKVQFGTPDVQRNALLQGELDIGIDYTGNGQYYSEGFEEEVWGDIEEGYNSIKTYDEENNGLTWLEPAKANNTEMLAVKREFAETNNLKTLEDFADYVNNGGQVKFITSQLFAEKNMGLLGMEEGYGFKLQPDQLIMLPHGNTAETISALANGTDDVNVALVYGTDGSLPDLDLVVLEDPLSIPPVFEPSVVIRSEILEKYPEIKDVIENTFKTLTLENLQNMNKKVIVDGLSPKDVAKDHLIEEGILE